MPCPPWHPPHSVPVLATELPHEETDGRGTDDGRTARHAEAVTTLRRQEANIDECKYIIDRLHHERDAAELVFPPNPPAETMVRGCSHQTQPPRSTLRHLHRKSSERQPCQVIRINLADKPESVAFSRARSVVAMRHPQSHSPWRATVRQSAPSCTHSGRNLTSQVSTHPTSRHGVRPLGAPPFIGLGSEPLRVFFRGGGYSACQPCERTGCGPAPPPSDDMSGLTVNTTASATVKWVITDWSKITGRVHHSETFSVGGHSW